MSEKKIIIKDEGESITYDIQGENVTVKDLIEMLIFTLMAINEESVEGLSYIERFKNAKELKNIVNNIIDGSWN